MEASIKNGSKLYSSYLQWSTKTPSTEEGVIVGADVTQEWILPWWWQHYKKLNHHPVAFIDFGMSNEARSWCRARGQLIQLPVADIFVSEKQEVNPTHIQSWENLYGKDFWIRRNGWFKKPLACLLSPYQTSIWIDLDCEIRSSIQELFTYATHPSGIALSKDIHESAKKRQIYNSGVIVFKRGLPLIEKWAHQSFELNHLYAGDQDILSKVIFDENITIAELPLIYNWSRSSGDDPDVLIYHWHGRHGKTVIALQCPPM
jgi:hypothetical protein